MGTNDVTSYVKDLEIEPVSLSTNKVSNVRQSENAQYIFETLK